MRAIFDGETILIATDQPYQAVSGKMVAAGATVERDVTVHDPLSVGSGGPGCSSSASTPRRSARRRPVTAAWLRACNGCSSARASSPFAPHRCRPRALASTRWRSARAGDQGTVDVEIDDKASPARLRLGRPVGVGQFAFQDAKATDTRLTVPFTSNDANPVLFIDERLYRCP